MTTSTIWLSYDLGVRGDYEGLYAWLDAHEARECGDAVAVLKYEHKDSLLEELDKDLSKNVSFDKNSRIYVIFRDRTTEKNKGKFIVGKRRAATWTGYAISQDVIEDEEV